MSDNEKLLKWIEEQRESYRKHIKRRIRPSKRNKQRKYCIGNINAFDLIIWAINTHVFDIKDSSHEDIYICINCSDKNKYKDLTYLPDNPHILCCSTCFHSKFKIERKERLQEDLIGISWNQFKDKIDKIILGFVSGIDNDESKLKEINRYISEIDMMGGIGLTTPLFKKKKNNEVKKNGKLDNN